MSLSAIVGNPIATTVHILVIVIEVSCFPCDPITFRLSCENVTPGSYKNDYIAPWTRNVDRGSEDVYRKVGCACKSQNVTTRRFGKEAVRIDQKSIDLGSTGVLF